MSILINLTGTWGEQNNPVAKKSLHTENLQQNNFLATGLFCSPQVVPRSMRNSVGLSGRAYPGLAEMADIKSKCCMAGAYGCVGSR